MFPGVFNTYTRSSLALAGLFSRCACLPGRPEAGKVQCTKTSQFVAPLGDISNHLSGQTL